MDLREKQAEYRMHKQAVTDDRLEQGALILTVLSEEHEFSNHLYK